MASRTPAATGSPALEAAGVPCGPINKLDEVFADPQVLARGIGRPAASAGRQRAPGREPAQAVGDAGRYPTAPPLLGQHTEEVLAERLGLDGSRVAALRAAGVI